MVRIMIKGGVWKNTEDEILKAAVMKYGKNQWARVASLLSRKSPKQCKARWYEWLDPSIKKTEWSREEEEKLLHMAKLMPNQWRTIAPIVGRTAAQCLQHYERLLDMAQESGGAGGDGEGAAAADDPRRLRPGEIDPHPETKPARPDPIDMDEDEKEMLSEARARLANTRGKKAKRKAREKQLEEAKRLATLQKRRELKAAGIEKTANRKRRKYIDYGKEIPFQRNAPAGFYDVSEENDAAKRARNDPTFSTKFLQDLEDKRRDEEDERSRQKDESKIKKMMKANLPQQIMAVNARNDPLPIRRRTELSLPAPQVSDAELEELVKMGAQAHAHGRAGSTSALLGDYSEAMPTPTPMRTPATPAGEDIVMQEARNLAILTSGKTPLLGGESASLEEGTGFGGINPRQNRMTTPSSMVVAGDGGGGTAGLDGRTPVPGTPSTVGGLTPGGRGGVGGRGIAGGTPLRDELGLNDDASMASMSPGGMSISSYGSSMLGPKEQRAREKRRREELRNKLEGLPAPQNEYGLVAPEVDEEADGAPLREEDAADRDARLAAEQAAREEAEFRKRSQAVQRYLPRPGTLSQAFASAGPRADSALATAEALVKAEAAKLVEHDSAAYPVASAIAAAAAAGLVTVEDGDETNGGKKKKKKKKAKASDAALIAAATGAIPEIESFEEEELMNARLLVEQEAEEECLDAFPSLSEFNEMWDACFSEWVYFPSRSAYGRISTATKADRVESAKHRFEALRAEADAQGAKARKLEGRLKMKLGGYSKVADQRAANLNRLIGEADNASIEASCFNLLLKAETSAIPRRVKDAENGAAQEVEAEELLQAEFRRLTAEKATLLEARAQARKAAVERRAAAKRARREQEEREAEEEERALGQQKPAEDEKEPKAKRIKANTEGEEGGENTVTTEVVIPAETEKAAVVPSEG